MEAGTVQPDEISPPTTYSYSAEEGLAPLQGNKRARLDEEDLDDDDDEGFDPGFDQDTTYIDPSATGGSSVGAAGRPRQRTVSNASNGELRERKPIQIEYIQDKSRRHITFSKRKAGIMKKVLLLVVSETGLVYTFTTPKLSAIVNEDHGQRLIEACLATEEGQQPAFATRDYGVAEPSLTIRRSNGDRSPRRRQPSSSGRASTPGSEGRRTSSRHVSHSSQPNAMPGPESMPAPRRMPSNPHLGQPPMPPLQPPVPMPPAPQSAEDQYNALYQQMAASSGIQSQTLSAPMSIPPYYTDGYSQEPAPHHAHQQWQ